MLTSSSLFIFVYPRSKLLVSSYLLKMNIITKNPIDIKMKIKKFLLNESLGLNGFLITEYKSIKINEFISMFK